MIVALVWGEFRPHQKDSEYCMRPFSCGLYALSNELVFITRQLSQ